MRVGLRLAFLQLRFQAIDQFGAGISVGGRPPLLVAFDRPGIEAKDLLVIRRGLFHVVLHRVDDRAAETRLAVHRVKPDRFAVVGDRLGQIALAGVDVAAAGPRGRLLLQPLHGAIQIDEGLLAIALHRQGEAPLAVNLVVLGIELDGAIVIGDRPLPPPLARSRIPG